MRDAEVAQELGLDFAAVSWGYTNPVQLARLPVVKMCESACDVLSLAVG
jgi:phosphoglycolate phosphatase-like HAD superfamily hydrolase